MPKTITVKGVGKATTKPDYVVLNMTLESIHKDYQKAMDIAADKIGQINDALACIGFEKEALKTTNFSVHTDYDRVKGKDGEYRSVFNGYEVTHNLKLGFDFDSEMLTKALSTIGSCCARPQLAIAFTVKDATAINEEMLRSATACAKRKAEILCDASGKTLGELISIDYNWGEIDIFSHTRYDCCDEMLAVPTARAIEIEPEDIQASDTATFVWEIN